MELTYSVRRSARARRVRISVDPQAGVRVTLPARAREQEAADAVAQLRPWIERRLAEAARTRATLAPPPGRVRVLDELLTLTPEAGRSRVHRRGDELLVPADGDVAAALERWYRRTARTLIAPRLDLASTAVGRPYARLTIRAQRTRWGSCSATGAMSFNWRLLLAPEAILDYVVWHEACHLVHLDHSTRFWGLLEHHCPGYRAPQRWLRHHGAGLVLPVPETPATAPD